MAITLSREAHLEFRCFGMADRHPKHIRAAVTELRRRGYDASVALLQYMVEEGLVEPEGERIGPPDPRRLPARVIRHVS
jgi:hypothetical protein